MEHGRVPAEHPAFAWGRMGWRALAVAVLATGCTGATVPAPSARPEATPASVPGSRPASAAGGSPATVAPVVCSGDDEYNQDDEGAEQGLLRGPDLPGGTWTVADAPPCPWALSADELLLVPACREIASTAAAPANDEARNGNARVIYAGPDGLELDHRVEIYTSRQNVDAIRAILAGPSASACFEAAVVQRATEDPGSGVTDIDVSRFAVEPGAAALGLGFPAVAGYAADPGFVEGVDVTFARSSGGASQPVAMRVVTFGSGGLMSTVTLIGATRAALDAVDLRPVIQAAARRYLAMVGPDR